MPGPLVAIFHQRPVVTLRPEVPLTHLLEIARDHLVDHQVDMFRAAGATEIELIGPDPERNETFGERLAHLAAESRPGHGLICFGGGAVPLLRRADIVALLAAAAAPGRHALTNNRYSSDLCAISDASALRDLPALPSDNALPRWLEERAGFSVRELSGRERLGLDVDGPLDLALLALLRQTPRPLRALASGSGLVVPFLDDFRALAADPRRELLVFGRSGSRTMRWLERHVRCRVRFLAEERGLRASTPLAIAGDPPPAGHGRLPASTLGLLLEKDGPERLAEVVATLSDGAILDTRVLMAQRHGVDESAWPPPEDRYASDLVRPSGIGDPWLRALTASAAHAAIPILLGAHTLVGPGLPILLGASQPSVRSADAPQSSRR